MAQYGTIITNIGLAQIANAQVTQTKVGLDYIALGDGNGAHYVPTQTQTALVREVWRGPIAELSIDPTNSNRIIIDAVIPVTAGGFTIREIGIFDDKNQLIAVGQYPEKYKPELSEGVSEETLIHFVIETNNADVVKLTIDPTVIIASRKYVDEKVAGINNGLTQITQKVTELETEFTTHEDDDAAHGIGSEPLETTAQTLRAAINETKAQADAAFTSASNGKTTVKNAITGVDPAVVIPPEPTFPDLAKAIGQISTGKKWAQGQTKAINNVLTINRLSFPFSFILLWIDSGKINEGTDNNQMVLAGFVSREMKVYGNDFYQGVMGASSTANSALISYTEMPNGTIELSANANGTFGYFDVNWLAIE